MTSRGGAVALQGRAESGSSRRDDVTARRAVMTSIPCAAGEGEKEAEVKAVCTALRLGGRWERNRAVRSGVGGGGNRNRK